MIRIETRENVPKLVMLFDWFIIYSFLGWIYETIYCSINLGRYSNRGFLFGPVCPIYGVCIVLAILFFSDRIKHNVTLFLLCAVLASAVEYIVSFSMEYIFGKRWWNYKNQLFNLNGRVCLGAAIVFGLMGILIIRYFHPKLVRFVNTYFNAHLLRSTSRVVLGVFLFDLLVTIKMNI